MPWGSAPTHRQTNHIETFTMTDPLNSQKPEDNIKDLMHAGLPAYRKAYSDWTAVLMARMSELAYMKFNQLSDKERIARGIQHILKLADDSADGHESKTLSAFIDTLKDVSTDGNASKTLSAIIDMLDPEHDHAKEKAALEEILKHWGLVLRDTFDKDGTQAFLAEHDEYAVLAFRGTEINDPRDIKTDFSITLKKSASGGFVHEGFQEAYMSIKDDIENALGNKSLNAKPLYLTGHSLGGALAMIAAKELSHEAGKVACYTFGAPKVANEEWSYDLKMPIYRIVNSADCIPLLPLGMAPCIKKLTLTIGAYHHCGDMRYLTHCPPRDYGHVQLLHQASLPRRAMALVQHGKVTIGIGKKLRNDYCINDHCINDHCIHVYRAKLMVIAKRRNPKDS
ncbi:MAG: lipase family protein [Candidatus Eutrophobiaceae bacterium]